MQTTPFRSLHLTHFKNTVFLIPWMLLFSMFNVLAEDPGPTTHESAELSNALRTSGKQLQQLFDESDYTGLGVAFMNASGVRYINGFGFADKENKISYTPTTFQPIASISKVIIAISLLRAQELGLLKLDDRADAHLPFPLINPHHPDLPITLRHLATHTAGIRDGNYYEHSYVFENPLGPIHKQLPWWHIERYYFGRLIHKYNANEDMDMATFLEKCFSPSGKWYEKSNFLRFKPGTFYDYSNCGATLAALAIEQASGIDYRTFVKREILDPLGMHASGWETQMNNDSSDKAALYLEGNRLPTYHLITYPDGGFVTSVDDFSKLMLAVMKGCQGENNILTAASYQEMLSQYGKPEWNTGIFWEVRKRTIGHSGMDPGVCTFAYFNRDRSEGYLLFANSVGFDFSEKPMLKILQFLTETVAQTH